MPMATGRGVAGGSESSHSRTGATIDIEPVTTSQQNPDARPRGFQTSPVPGRVQALGTR